MAYNGLYRLFGRAVARHEIVDYRNVYHLIDIKVSRKDHIHNGTDFARITVFKRKHRAIAVSVFDRSVSVREFTGGDKFRFGEHLFRRKLRKRAFRSAVRNFRSLYCFRLIFA